MGRIASRNLSAAQTVLNTPIGGISPVFRSGLNFKAVGEIVQRSLYAALSAAFPRTGALNSVSTTLQTTSVANKGSAFGNGVFISLVGGGSTNQYQRSDDGGKTWRILTMPTSDTWQFAMFGNNMFVVFGAAKIYTSANALDWVDRGAPLYSVNCGAWNGSIFVAAVSGTSNAMSSPDGITWTSRSMPASASWSKIVVGPSNKFLAITAGTQGATSTNGTAWTSVTLPSSTVNAAAANTTTFVCGDQTKSYYSADGASWSAGKAALWGNNLDDICYADGVFLASLNSNLFVSYDGQTWNYKPSLSSGPASGKICFGAGAFLIIPTSGAGTAAFLVYAEDTSTSDYLYLQGTAGQFIRVQ